MVTRLFQIASTLFLLSAFSSHLSAESNRQITVSAGKYDRQNIPVQVDLKLPRTRPFSSHVILEDSQGNKLAGQLTDPSLLNSSHSDNSKSIAKQLHFILPELTAGQSKTFTYHFTDGVSHSDNSFQWRDSDDGYTELTTQGKKILRYMRLPYDDSTPETRGNTYKVFHHLFDPQGKRPVTKGPGGRYTHHRGLFFGFNRVTYGDNQKVDIWHCKGDTHQAHSGNVSQQAGSVLGRHVVTVDWHGIEKKIFAAEQRELTAYNLPGGLLIEFASRVKTTGGKIKLDGDPQHAGFHFRGAQQIAAETFKQTYYVRPDGADTPGNYRNWPKNKDHVNLPWNAMSFVLDGNRYTACYLDHPKNPKESRFSERNYGRFGSYFEYTIEEDKPLEVNYRLWLQEGEMTVDQIAALSKQFVEPVQVKLSEQ